MMTEGWSANLCSKYHVLSPFTVFGRWKDTKEANTMFPRYGVVGIVFVTTAFAVILALMPNITVWFLTTRQLLESGFGKSTAVSNRQYTFRPSKEHFCSRSLALSMKGDVFQPVAKGETSVLPLKHAEKSSSQSGLHQESQASLKLAKEMDQLGKTEKAARLYVHALDLDPTDPDVLNEYGEFLERSKQDLVNAEHMYCRAVVANPSHRRALINRQRTLPLVEDIDQGYFNLIDRKLDILMSVPENHPGIRRMMKESYYRHIYHTTAIEGNTFTLSQTRSLVENRLAIGGKSIMEHNEILGMDAAFSFINSSLTQRLGALTVTDILSIHRRVLGFVDPIQSGEFRTTQVFVGDYVPPEAGLVPDLMEEFMDWLNSEDALSLHPIELAALAHYKLVCIHPFYDGNGRTSRLLMNVILMESGYPPIIIRVEDKHLYYQHLVTANNGDIRPFIRFIALNTERSVDEYLLAGLENPGALVSLGLSVARQDDGRTIILEGPDGNDNNNNNNNNENNASARSERSNSDDNS